MSRGMLLPNQAHSSPQCTHLAPSFHVCTGSGLHRGNLSIHQRRIRGVSALKAVVSLADVELTTVLDTEGFISAAVNDDVKASVFAIFDEGKKLQYIGFSKDLDSSLKTVFTRRPDKTYFYKASNFKELNQEEMMEQRDAWFKEVGGPPSGNKLALERVLWQEPIESDAISSRGRMAAAEEKAREMLEKYKLRGCNEDFIPDPSKLPDGQVDFLPTKKLTAEEIEARKAERDAIAKASRNMVVDVKGNAEEVSIFFASSFDSNGGRVFDIRVGHDGRDTEHRVIIGKQYYEPYEVEAEEVVMHAMGFLISLGEVRHTEGLLQTSQFPVNYFSMSDMELFFPTFGAEFSNKFGELKANDLWRFNRIHDYGPMYEDPRGMSLALGGSYLDVNNKDDDSIGDELVDETVPK